MSTKNVSVIGNRGRSPGPISSLRPPSPRRAWTTGQVLKHSGPTSRQLRHSASKNLVFTVWRSGACPVTVARLRAGRLIVVYSLSPEKRLAARYGRPCGWCQPDSECVAVLCVLLSPVRADKAARIRDLPAVAVPPNLKTARGTKLRYRRRFGILRGPSCPNRHHGASDAHVRFRDHGAAAAASSAFNVVWLRLVSP